MYRTKYTHYISSKKTLGITSLPNCGTIRLFIGRLELSRSSLSLFLSHTHTHTQNWRNAHTKLSLSHTRWHTKLEKRAHNAMQESRMSAYIW